MTQNTAVLKNLGLSSSLEPCAVSQQCGERQALFQPASTPWAMEVSRCISSRPGAAGHGSWLMRHRGGQGSTEGKAASFPAHLRHSDGTWYFFTQCPHLSAENRDDGRDGAWENDGRVSQDSNPGSTANSGLCSHTLCCKQGQGRRKARDEWVHVPVTSSLKKSQGGKGEKDL